MHILKKGDFHEQKDGTLFWGGGIAVALVALGAVTQAETKKAEQELKDASVYIKLVSSWNELNWEKTNLFFVTGFEVRAMGVQSYFVTPVWSGLVTGMVDFGIEKLEHFPEDIWAEYDFLNDGTYYYPGSKEKETEWKDNEYLAVSFDRPYTIEEVMNVEELAAARWFWIDTLEGSVYSQEGYVPSPSAGNCAFGVDCELDELSRTCENWIHSLNLYEADSKTESGQKIYALKENISGNEPVQLEDIRILGCEIQAFGYKTEKEMMKEKPMFHVVQSVNNQ